MNFHVFFDKMVFSCCGGNGAATWNQTNGTWNCSDCGSVQSTDSGYIGGGFKQRDGHTPTPNTDKVCTCGSTKTYGKDAKHSSWCDKYEKK